MERTKVVALSVVMLAMLLPLANASGSCITLKPNHSTPVFIRFVAHGENMFGITLYTNESPVMGKQFSLMAAKNYSANGARGTSIVENLSIRAYKEAVKIGILTTDRDGKVGFTINTTDKYIFMSGDGLLIIQLKEDIASKIQSFWEMFKFFYHV